MKNKYLAKTEKEKTIKQHSQDLLDQLDIWKKIYPQIMEPREWELLNYTVKYHDLGKINTKFQNKLYKILYGKEFLEDTIKEEEIPHNYLSTAFINTKQLGKKFTQDEIKILVSAVYYHHNREEKEITEDTIEDLKNQGKELGDFFDLNLNQIRKCSKKYILKPIDKESIELLESKKYINIKGGLNRLDYVASMDKENVKIEEDSLQDGKSIAGKIQEITKEKYQNKYREVQTYMMENQDKNLIVISYTGSGKTEAALLWIGKEKAFYTLPLKASINAIYERIINEIGYGKALLLHSDAYLYYEELDKNTLNEYDRARRMAAPLIVTTVDQLFKIAFRYKGYEEILQVLSYSKIIIDEIQMYSPQMLAYILIALSIIIKVGGKFAIITATFPPILYHLMDQLRIPYEKQKVSFKPHINNRHRIQIFKKQDINIESIKKEAENKRVLVLANTVKKAQELYEKIKKENIHLLHSHYLKTDRKLLENEIFKFGNDTTNTKTGIWISTQIVEASLDIDFDVLFTEMCSIDSLFQRMGRVYRKREYHKEEPNVYIFDNQNGVPYIIDEQIYEISLNEIKQYNNQNLSEETKQEMIENIFSLEKNKELKKSKYYETIKKEINLLTEIAPNEIDKSLIDKKFRNIQNVKLIPDNIFESLYKEGKIEEWEEILQNKTIKTIDKIKVKNEIEEYVVSVRWSPKLEMDEQELFFKGSAIYRTKYIYEFDKKTLKGQGLIMKIPEKLGYFDE